MARPEAVMAHEGAVAKGLRRTAEAGTALEVEATEEVPR